jgi:hypothetical protein
LPATTTLPSGCSAAATNVSFPSIEVTTVPSPSNVRSLEPSAFSRRRTKPLALPPATTTFPSGCASVTAASECTLRAGKALIPPVPKLGSRSPGAAMAACGAMASAPAQPAIVMIVCLTSPP